MEPKSLPRALTGLGLERRHLDRTMPWRLVKKYCRAADINPDRLDGRGIGIHSLRKTILQHLIANGTPMHEVREFAGHSDIRTTDLYFSRRDDDAEKAARNIRIRVPTKQGS
jgi:integrase